MLGLTQHCPGRLLLVVDHCSPTLHSTMTSPATGKQTHDNDPPVTAQRPLDRRRVVWGGVSVLMM